MNGDNEQYFSDPPAFMNQPAESLAALDDHLRGMLQDYARREPSHDALAAEFGTLIDEAEDPFCRERLAGHFTASCWLVSADGQRLLLTHHRKLQRWLQLGGHADGDRDLARVALKEAGEESGLTGLVLDDPAIFDLDKHWIPARVAGEAFVLSEESLDLAWRPVAEVAADPASDESMQRMANRWLAR